MRLDRLGEFGAIDLIKSVCAKPGPEVRAGIGDDAASFVPGPGQTLVSTDMLVEGVHFDLAYTGFTDLGYRSLAANLSDIAAMGGTPRYYLVSLALTGGEGTKGLTELYRGFESAAGPYGVRAIGGDTCRTTGPAVISVTIIGEAGPKGPVLRSTARPGDDIYVTGTLGDSAAGLAILRAGKGASGAAVSGGAKRGRYDEVSPAKGAAAKAVAGDHAAYLVSRHLRPSARVIAGTLLGGSGLASAMIDVSDGFSSDLGHILDDSGVGAVIDRENLPVSDALSGFLGRSKAARSALHGGEDYELIFTARPGAHKKVAALFEDAGTMVSLVGRVTVQKGAYLRSRKGAVKALMPRGYEHFRK